MFESNGNGDAGILYDYQVAELEKLIDDLLQSS